VWHQPTGDSSSESDVERREGVLGLVDVGMKDADDDRAGAGVGAGASVATASSVSEPSDVATAAISALRGGDSVGGAAAVDAIAAATAVGSELPTALRAVRYQVAARRSARSAVGP